MSQPDDSNPGIAPGDPGNLDDPNLIDPNNPEPPGDPGDPPEPAPFIRDFDEETAYGILSRARELPDNLTAMENRVQGGLGDLTRRFDEYQKGLPTQSSFDAEKIQKGLEAYDPKLAEVLGPLLQDAFKTSALDEATLSPHLSPMKTEMQDWMGQQLVLSAYSPEALADIVPPVKDGRFEPQGERHKDFISWYTKQGYQTQQALLSFGAPYVQALRQFEKWEAKTNEDRAANAGKQTQRLQNGQVPSSRKNLPPKPKPLTPDEAMQAGFDEVIKEMS